MPKRHYLLDVLRGFASLAVVLWHYQHFFFVAPGELEEGFTRSSLPFYSFLSLFYDHGNSAVQLFFVLSGFIFFWLYRQKIDDEGISAGEFFILRFSRLYPLHFATLIFVAAGQGLFVEISGQSFIYENNDLKHFVLNLLFASQWGLQEGWSFNAPVWSVSIEVLLYALFFVYAMLGLGSLWSCGALMLAGMLIAAFTSAHYLGLGVFCFFAGGAVFQVYDAVRTRSSNQARRIQVALVAAVMTMVAAWVVRMTDGVLSMGILFGGVFPLLVLTLALAQEVRHDLGRPLRVVGDITYSTYLLHFPLQLLIVAAATKFAIDIDYRAPLVFIGFFAVLVTLSLQVYRRFELPAQRYLRQRLPNLAG